MRRSGAEGRVGRAIGSVMHVGLQGQEGMHVELQSQMVAADVNFFRVLQGQWARRWALRCMWDCRDRKVCMWNCSHKGWRQTSIFFRVLQGHWAGRWALRCMWDCRDRKVCMWNCSHKWWRQTSFFFGCCRASGQGDGLCDACGIVGTGRYACGTAVTNASF